MLINLTAEHTLLHSSGQSNYLSISALGLSRRCQTQEQPKGTHKSNGCPRSPFLFIWRGWGTTPLGDSFGLNFLSPKMISTHFQMYSSPRPFYILNMDEGFKVLSFQATALCILVLLFSLECYFHCRWVSTETSMGTSFFSHLWGEFPKHTFAIMQWNQCEQHHGYRSWSRRQPCPHVKVSTASRPCFSWFTWH